MPETTDHSSPAPAKPSTDLQEIKELLEKNLRLSETIAVQSRKTLRRFTWYVVGQYVKLALIIIPLVVGAIYLPPLFRSVWQQYGSLFGGQTRGSSTADSITQYVNLLRQ